MNIVDKLKQAQNKLLNMPAKLSDGTKGIDTEVISNESVKTKVVIAKEMLAKLASMTKTTGETGSVTESFEYTG